MDQRGGRRADTYTTATLPQVELGGRVFRSVPLAVYDRWTDPSLPLNLGLPLLSRFRLLAADYRQDGLWLAPDPAAEARPFERERSGVAATLNGGRLLVVFVAPGSPAEAAGLHAGQAITKVDGRSIAELARTTGWRAWRSGPAGAAVELTLAEGAPVRLVLADYD